MSGNGSIRFNLAGLEEFHDLIRKTMHTRGNTPARQMLRKWGTRYLAFVKREYVKNSKGGGGWTPLSRATLRSRRKGTGSKVAADGSIRNSSGQFVGKVAILRDTGTLLAALDPGNPGNHFKDKPGAVVVGFANTRHPKGGSTIAQIASYHQEGKGVPKRPILVEPDAATVSGMMGDGKRAIEQTLALAAGKVR